MAVPTAEPAAAVVRGVSKSFRLPSQRIHTLKERVLHPLRRTDFQRFDALRHVSFEVARG